MYTKQFLIQKQKKIYNYVRNKYLPNRFSNDIYFQ